MWAQGAGQVGWPHLSCSHGLLRWFALWCLLESSGVVFIMDNHVNQPC
jgi:hypothetical protein